MIRCPFSELAWLSASRFVGSIRFLITPRCSRYFAGISVGLKWNFTAEGVVDTEAEQFSLSSMLMSYRSRLIAADAETEDEPIEGRPLRM